MPAKEVLAEGAERFASFLYACIDEGSVKGAVKASGINAMDAEDAAKLTDPQNVYGAIEVIGHRPTPAGSPDEMLVVFFKVRTNKGPYVFEIQGFRQPDDTWAIKLVNWLDAFEQDDREQFFVFSDWPHPINR